MRVLGSLGPVEKRTVLSLGVSRLIWTCRNISTFTSPNRKGCSRSLACRTSAIHAGSVHCFPIGDYLLPSGRNRSFLVNASTETASWKRLLRGSGLHVPEKCPNLSSS